MSPFKLSAITSGLVTRVLPAVATIFIGVAMIGAVNDLNVLI
ncbi:hypothetical protein [Parvularcula dongshanensis]|uniref:Uncharacterized protein n=1 Tax=Parvularcula dongshanensis TaxID=1173995 RepID=A0A840I4Y1_9PROT|nr:hypothetical protein [Parvularcula dongshanensis]MBB4659889.1 hypothetical protein [Parvularcula dongshanensis]